MVQRLLFNWIDAETGTSPIGRQYQLPAHIATDEAEASTAFWYVAFAWAESAHYFARIGIRVPPFFSLKQHEYHGPGLVGVGRPLLRSTCTIVGVDLGRRK